MTLRWRRTTQRHKVSLDFAICNALVLARAGLALKRSSKAFFNEAALDAINFSGTDVQNLRNVLAGASLAAINCNDIAVEQDQSVD